MLGYVEIHQKCMCVMKCFLMVMKNLFLFSYHEKGACIFKKPKMCYVIRKGQDYQSPKRTLQ